MARLVRNHVVREKRFTGHWPMPQLEGHALDRQRACIGNRIDEFLENKPLPYSIPEDTPIPYLHRLSYDAESTLWLLLSWAIQIQPQNGDKLDEIPLYIWLRFTGGAGPNDPRHAFVDHYLKGCHSMYGELDGLLRSLFEQLSGYQEYVALQLKDQDATRMKDEYLHEALQRIILGFIIEHHAEPFMRTEISRARRRTEKAEWMSQSTSVPGTGTGTGTGTVSQGVKRKRATLEDDTEKGKTHPKRYACPHVFHHVGADIPAGTDEKSKRRADVQFRASPFIRCACSGA